MKNLQYLSVDEAAKLLADYTITAEAMICACFDQGSGGVHLRRTRRLSRSVTILSPTDVPQ